MSTPQPQSGPEKTAAILLIGNELLSGKIQDANAHWLAKRLFTLGVRLRRVELVPDEVPIIAEAVRRLSEENDWLFTSGGVGPTHDDMTIPSVAAAFQMEVVRAPELETGIRGHYGDQVTEGHLRMADAPAGYELIEVPGVRWPVLCCRNVFILPGVPELFRLKFEAVQERFRQSPIHLRQLYLMADEGAVAALLQQAQEVFQDVEVGSYPTFSNPTYRLKITVEGRAESDVEAVLARIRGGVDPSQLVDESEVRL